MNHTTRRCRACYAALHFEPEWKTLCKSCYAASKKREQAQLQAEVAGLRSLVDALTERVAALERALAAAEASAETAAHVRAEAEARAWHALAHARALTAWADTVTAIVPDTVSLPPRPPVPVELEADL